MPCRRHIRFDGARDAEYHIGDFMAGRTKPVCIRLTMAEIDQLQARAYALSATTTGVARDLIRVGLASGDNKALADRLMLIERRLVVLEQQGREVHVKRQAIDQATCDLLSMFDSLLKALTGESPGRAA